MVDQQHAPAEQRTSLLGRDVLRTTKALWFNQQSARPAKEISKIGTTRQQAGASTKTGPAVGQIGRQAGFQSGRLPT